MIGAAPVLCLGAAWLITIIKDHAWPLPLRERQLDYLGWSLLALIALIGVVVVALASVKVKGSAGPVDFEVDGDDTTTTTNVSVETKA